MALTPQEGDQREALFLAECRRSGQVWVLRRDGGFANWREDGVTVVPVWAGCADAAACAAGSLGAYEPEALSLRCFRDDILGLLAGREVWIAVHPDPDLGGNRVPAERLVAALAEDGA